MTKTGPLPIADHNSALQRESVQKLRSALPADKFVVREETGGDYGTDLVVEVLKEQRATNIRAHIQVKSTESVEQNADGSISISVESSNLNYLLNQPSSLYVLYRKSGQQLRFVWAREELGRIEVQAKTWADQKTVTLRFVRKLDAAAVNEVWERIIAEGELQREVRDQVARQAAGTIAHVFVDPTTLRATTPDEIADSLRRYGVSLVAAGYPHRVRELFQHLADRPEKVDPSVVVAGAYANYALGRFLEGATLCAYAAVRVGELNAGQRALLSSIGNSCDYELGRIDRTTYVARLRDAEGSDISLQQKFYALHYERLDAKPAWEGRDATQAMDALLDEILRLDEDHAAFKLQARVLRADWLVDEMNSQLAALVIDERWRAQQGWRGDTNITLSSAKELEAIRQRWQSEVQAIEVELGRLGHPLLSADAILSITGSQTRTMLQSRLIGLVAADDTKHRSTLEALLSRVEWVFEQYERLGSLSGSVRARLLKCDVLDLLGRDAESKQLGQELVPLARAIQMPIAVKWAEDHASGNTLLRQGMPARESAEASDAELAAFSDQEIVEFARNTLRTLQLPDERLPAAVIDAKALRQLATERLRWCRHLSRLQDLRHMTDTRTAYASPTMNKGHCTLLGHKSLIPSADVDSLLRAFKATYCTTCGHREPVLK